MPEPKAASAPLTIGFSARDLSNAKGFDTYVRLVDKLVERGLKANFVALGGSEGSTYGYEQQWVQRKYGGEVASFRDHLLKVYPRAAEVIAFPGKLPYEAFVEKLSGIDIFLYPLRFGVANWGLVEILGRGGCVLAPDRGYPAELIQDDVNGRLLPDDDEAWIDEITAPAQDPERRLRYGQSACARARLLYSLQAVAPRYLNLFRLAMDRRQARLRNGS
ncbi:glycosyltransferase [Ponticoccus litoralis]|uniref:Glycosyltransferase n=1 Tax=Ponticoccus litoralis TaxID=422297 RepID=A0AAW9SH95_9RHOB